MVDICHHVSWGGCVSSLRGIVGSVCLTFILADDSEGDGNINSTLAADCADLCLAGLCTLNSGEGAPF
jgi:hypothetical protein